MSNADRRSCDRLHTIGLFEVQLGIPEGAETINIEMSVFVRQMHHRLPRAQRHLRAFKCKQATVDKEIGPV